MQAANLTKLKWKLTSEQKQQVVFHWCNGVSVSIICKNYHIDHSTIYYHLKKARVFIAGQPREMRSIHQIMVERPAEAKILPMPRNIEVATDFDGDKLCLGHDYATYLKQAKENRYKHFGI